MPDSKPSVDANARAIAFFLPQFYPVAENDRWWGPGFTEWTNVSQADPLFDGHYQPHVPADVGYYDLRVPEVRELQAELARKHGIEGFCYWHYWFEGKRMLERPYEEILDSGAPDLPFCLAWANETWTRRWHGSGEGAETLVAQTYSIPDDRAHAQWLVRSFADPRYIRLNGRPLFLVYRPFDLPDPQRTLGELRSECTRSGVGDPYLIGIDAHNPSLDTRTLGFDATLAFEPQFSALADPTRPGLHVYDYLDSVRRMRRQKRDYPTIPCVMVGWDNTPRRGRNGAVFRDASPELFADGLREAVAGLAQKPAAERLIFINAWNEWAEGNHLEPDLRFGSAWLEAVREIVG